MNKITINIYVNEFPKTSETFIFNKVKFLLEQGYNINLFASKFYFEDENYDDLRNFPNFKYLYFFTNVSKSIYKIPIVVAKKHFWKRFVKNHFNLKKSISEALKYETLIYGNPNYIHFEFSGIGINFSSVLNEINNIKIVSSFRGAAEKITPNVYDERKIKISQLVEFLDICHCVSFDMANEIQKYTSKILNTVIIHPSIDVQKFKFNTEYHFNSLNKINIISVGRLHWKKGIDIALLSLAKLKKDGINFQYTLVGEGFEFEKLKYLSYILGLKNEVVFTGKKSSKEVYKLLLQSQLYLLPSYNEGISNAALEAMSTGIPVISSNIDGMPEAVIHEQNGFIFERGNADELYYLIKSIFNNKYDLEMIRKNARKIVEEKFNLNLQIIKYKEIYN